MKVTVSNARADKAGKHNDRNFDLDYAPHIDQGRVKDNRYWTYNGQTDVPFSELEEGFYRDTFSAYIGKQNEKKRAYGNANRSITAERYHKMKNSRPEDVVLEIGNMLEHAPGEELYECAMAYVEAFNKAFGERCRILDLALHMDEEAPHVHIRRVWIAEDEQGDAYVCQTKALEQMGIERPDTSRPEDRKNNAKVTFTDMDREMFRQACIARGHDIDPPPRKGKRGRTAIDEYKRKSPMLAQALAELETRKAAMEDELDAMARDLKERDGELAGKEAELAEKAGELESARNEIENARGETENVQGELKGVRNELEDARSELEGIRDEIERARDMRREVSRQIISGMDTMEAQDQAMEESNERMLAVIMADEGMRLMYASELEDLEEKRLSDRNAALFEILLREQDRLSGGGVEHAPAGHMQENKKEVTGRGDRG